MGWKGRWPTPGLIACLTTADTTGPGVAPTQATPASPYYQNLYDPHADYASCYFDSSNILSAYATYDLPIGKGKAIGNNMNSVVNAVVGDWQVSTIVSTPQRLSSGRLREQPILRGPESRGPRPNCGPQQVHLRSSAKLLSNGAFQGYQWMSPSGIFGAGNGNLRQLPVAGTSVLEPGFPDTDIGVSKNFHLTEPKYFQFRGDFLNAFNNVQLGHPNTNFPSSTFGLINTSQPARNIQFALKFYY